MANLKEVRVPDLGGSSNVPVIELLIAVGDTVSLDQSIVTLESDKATMEVPSPVAGIVKELKARVGDTLSEGDLVALIEVAGATPVATPIPEPVPAEAKVEPPPAEPPATLVAREIVPVPAGDAPHAGPAVRQLARQLGVTLAQVQGTGRGGRIVREDVTDHVKRTLSNDSVAPAVPAFTGGQNLLPWPKIDFAKFGEIEEQALGRIPKLSAANLARNWAVIPHVTQHDQADITDLESFRVALNKEADGPRLTMLAFLMKASAVLLRTFPRFNASLDASGETLTLKKYVHIGFAADTPQGLVVPVVRDIDRKGIREIAEETASLARKAREGQLTASDMQGGCFTISSLGGIGGTAFTPIVNAPEVAILGVSRASMQPVWNGDTFLPRLMLPTSLSYDHRVIDGADAARFSAALTCLLADFRRVLL
ncbi:MAG: Dihydrolipoyllysine-residue acetyltransferase component of pyruvate dehydrogenase complex [Luteibacter sp.]|uniref:dihydrolipoyllysine-residue acetyltransferase n=1 Tax=Luteibacter sp. TaxID=1886636 RepID=UPI0013865976|nr:dihydrolipoyllysine-residue acetyltransferase [Luteibacter sp.]KAF1004826.1 MAG: Dihydrolipoyllysine-residue acetyltransferase component of pyruvate dehydrogenase complex [Luteibacter sp.]